MAENQTDRLLRPTRKPSNPHFSCGPTTKRPGWSPDALSGAFVGRSHRAAEGKARLKKSIDMMRRLLALPDDYYIGIVPASDTGAVEMAMWSMLGARGADMLAWDAFGKDWVVDAAEQLKLDDVRIFDVPYGHLPDLTQVADDRDVVLAWNGTSAGVQVPNGDWINPDREGLIIVDATSAIFSVPMPIEKLDAVTFSWQKSLGGEAGHGVLILSPKAVRRLETYTPPWPLPKIFRLTEGGKLNKGIFEGVTINTPSMLCVEDAIDALTWAESIGGLKALMARVDANFGVIKTWVDGNPDLAFLAEDEATISHTSMTIKITADWFAKADVAQQSKMIKSLLQRLEAEGAAFDIAPYSAAPPGLRIWTGAMVEATDLAALTPWIDWALAELKRSQES